MMPAPPALDLPRALRNPAPEQQRDAMHHLASQAAWADLAWPQFLEHLMALGRADVPLARLAEGHIDALRILSQADTAPKPGSLYGVWASRSGGTGLTATATDGGWHLTGRLLFASGAGVLDRALVTAWPGPETHVLLDAPVADWEFDSSHWRTRAMEHSRSHRVHLDRRVEAHQVGEENFYLARWGFFPGGVGVAAVWAGGAARVLDLLAGIPITGEAKAVRIGRARTELASAVALIRQAGSALEARPAEPRPLATIVRAGVAAAVRRLLADARSVAGPAGLAFDEDLTRAIDDLFLYVSQQNADGDSLFLGQLHHDGTVTP